MDRDQQWAADVRTVAAAALLQIANAYGYRQLGTIVRAELDMIGGGLRDALPDADPCVFCYGACGAAQGGPDVLGGCPLTWWDRLGRKIPVDPVRAEAARRATAVTLAYVAQRAPADLTGEQARTMAVLTTHWIPGDPCGICSTHKGPCAPPCPLPVPAPWTAR